MAINGREELALGVIDKWLDYRSRYSQLPGFQVCIRKKGDIVFSKAYGHANLNTKRILNTKDLFHIASHSKTFTSCAILQLVEQGKLSLQQSAVDYLPELKGHKDKRFKQVTIRDLLSNRSGLFRDGIESDFWELQKPFLSKEQLLQEILASDLIVGPNEWSKYSNIGFSLLGLVLEKVLGVSYQKAMDLLVLQKLSGTQIFPDYSENLGGSFADGHSRPFFEGKRLPLKHAPALAMAPATGFCANAEDTSLFFDKLLLGKGLIKKETQQELLSLNWAVKNSPEERYGLGVHFDRLSDMDLIGHSGGYPGYSTDTAHWEGSNYIISFFLNTNDMAPANAVTSIIRIFNIIKATFTDTEAETAIISEPLMNKWGSKLFVLSKKAGLCLPLESWLPCKEALHLSSKNGEDYLCDKQSGYSSAGEKISFKKDNAGNILSAKWGSTAFLQEKAFLEKFKNTLL